MIGWLVGWMSEEMGEEIRRQGEDRKSEGRGHSSGLGWYLLENTMSSSEKAMAPHSSTLAWKIPWMEEPGRLQSMGSLRVGHDWATSLSLFTFTHWRRKWQPTPVFLPGESQGRGSLAGRRLWGHTVGYDWSDLAAAAATFHCAYVPHMCFTSSESLQR